MKFNYLPISLTYNTLLDNNVRALFAKMAKEQIVDLGSVFRTEFNVTSDFETFIFKRDSTIANRLVANPRETIELDLSDFQKGVYHSEDGSEYVYYHLDVLK